MRTLTKSPPVSTPAPARARNRQATEEALITAACEAFAEMGYEGTTTKTIAEKAGCSEALIQRYFNGKEGLLLAVLREEDRELELGFLRRPLCPSLIDEAREALTHALEVMTSRSRKMRIVLSRVLVDPSFKRDFDRLCIYRDVKSEAIQRFMRYRETGMLCTDLNLEAMVEMLMGLSFDVGFLQSELLDSKPDRQRLLIEHFAVMFGRAVSAPVSTETPRFSSA